MINKTEKKRIKKVIGHRYVSLIQADLKANNENNRNGEAYSSAQITNVMNGESNDIIEASIYRVVAQKKKVIANRKALLTKKPVVGAAGF